MVFRDGLDDLESPYREVGTLCHRAGSSQYHVVDSPYREVGSSQYHMVASPCPYSEGEHLCLEVEEGRRYREVEARRHSLKEACCSG